MATQKRFIAKNGLDNNSVTITNVADPVGSFDAATKNFSTNASNLATGTVSTSRLGSGTQDSTTFLRGDGGWSSALTGSLTATALIPSGSTIPLNGLYLPSSNTISLATNTVQRLLIDSNGNVVINTAALSTSATNGFLYVTTSAGVPTGIPTTYTGRSPVHVDTTDNALYFYSSGAWRVSSGGSGSVTSVNVSGSTTGLTFSGGPITTSGTISMAGTLNASNGGTGQTVYAVGDLLYASTTTALSKLAASTSGLVLTANGAGVAPTWQAGGISGSNIAWTNGSSTLILGPSGGNSTAYIYASESTSANPGSALSLRGGTNSSTGIGGSVILHGGYSQNSTPGAAIISGGERGAGGLGGHIQFNTYTPTWTERFRILADGSWSLGASGTAVGTTGQVITSNGSGSLPTWTSLATVGTITTGVWNAGAVTSTGQIIMSTVGTGLSIKEGTNAKMGVATLSSGTVVVSTTAVTATSRIFLTAQTLGTITVPVGLAVSARTAGTSFTILSGNLSDTSIIAWMLVEPS